MRIPFSSAFRSVAYDVNASAGRLSDAQQLVGSGKRIDRPSDDPAGSSSAIMDHAALGSIEGYSQTNNSATSRLSVMDTTLSDVINLVTSAQTTVAGARGSTQTQQSRDAAALKLQGISDSLFADFNAQFHGTYLFSGTKATTAPFNNTGGTVSAYQGNTSTASVDLGRGPAAPISFDGSAIAQGSDATDIFATLANVITAIKAGDSTGMSNGLDALGRMLDRATHAQSQVGAALSTLEDAKSKLTQDRLNITTQLSGTEDADMAAAITTMSQSETAYKAALGALGRIGSVSLMDYLR